MNIAVLGTGVVGQTLSVKLNELGHGVFMGCRKKRKSLRRKLHPANHFRNGSNQIPVFR